MMFWLYVYYIKESYLQRTNVYNWASKRYQILLLSKFFLIDRKKRPLSQKNSKSYFDVQRYNLFINNNAKQISNQETIKNVKY